MIILVNFINDYREDYNDNDDNDDDDQVLQKYYCKEISIILAETILKIDSTYHIPHLGWYDTVYIDLDDTIIIKNKVNTKIMQYLFYLKNNNKKIILITKNSEPHIILDKYFIHINLFDEIIKVKKNEKKSQYINNLNSIFIDDSYQERIDVFNTNNIYVFSCDMIE